MEFREYRGRYALLALPKTRGRRKEPFSFLLPTALAPSTFLIHDREKFYFVKLFGRDCLVKAQEKKKPFFFDSVRKRTLKKGLFETAGEMLNSWKDEQGCQGAQLS